MPTLQEKVLQLKLEAAAASRLALWYEKQIEIHGIAKVESFYSKGLGLNHIERKSVEFEGLQLRRNPRDSEKLAVKGVATAQNDGQSSVSTVLLHLRSWLISDGLRAITAISPAKYHTLILQIPPGFRQGLKDRLRLIYRHGRALVQQELGATKADIDDDFDELDTLIDVTDSRVANDVQARIIAAAARATLAGLTGDAFEQAVRSEVESGSTAYIERTATGLANKTVAIGRGDEMQSHADEIDRYEYSALLDANVCGPCAADDGETASDPSDLTPTPNPECDGGDYCRCFTVAITA